MSRVEPNRNVYVGHRYVPKIFGEWDNQNEYEGLSIVTHQGASYTSKKRVPVGIDINNKEYWVITGNYDAQVEYYRQETNRVSEKLDEKADIQEMNDYKISVNKDITEFKSDTNEVINDFKSVTNGVINDFKIDTNESIEKFKYRINLLDVHPGLNGKDITDHANSIINELYKLGGGTLYIPDGEFLVNGVHSGLRGFEGGIHLKDNVNLITHRNTKLKVIVNNSNWYDIIVVNKVKNSFIYVAHLIGDKDYHEGSTGEWGHGITVNDSSNITLNINKVTDMWGDGIYLRGITNSKIVVDSIDNTRRQGISFIHGSNVEIVFDSISNVRGTMPQSAIDFENNSEGEKIENVTVTGRRVFNCLRGMHLYPNKSSIRNIKFDIKEFESVETPISSSGAYTGIIENIEFNNFDLGNGNVELIMTFINKKNITFNNCINIDLFKLQNTENIKVNYGDINRVEWYQDINTIFYKTVFHPKNDEYNQILNPSPRNTKFIECEIIGGTRPIGTGVGYEVYKCIFKNVKDRALGTQFMNCTIKENTFINCELSAVISSQSHSYNTHFKDNYFINTPEIHKPTTSPDSLIVEGNHIYDDEVDV